MQRRAPWLISPAFLVTATVVVGLAAASWFSAAGFASIATFTGALVATFIGAMIVLKPAFGVFLILFALPFERIPSMDIAGITVRANFFFGGMAMLGFALAWLRGKHTLAPNPVRLPLYLFFIVAFFSATHALAERRALLTLAFIIFTAGFEMIIVNALRTPAALRRAMTVLWWSAAVVGVFGIYQFFGDLIGLPTVLTGLRDLYTKAVFGFPRVQAFSIEPLYLGSYLLLPLSLIAASLFGRVRSFSRPWLWVLFALLGLVFILTLSRGAYLAAATAAAVIAVTLPRSVFAPRNLLMVLLIGVVALVGAAGFVSRGSGNALEQFVKHASLGDLGSGESTQGRFLTYRQAFAAWQEAPLMGIGVGNFGPHILGYPDPSTVNDWPIVNNEYLELLAETGILGLGAIIILFVLVGIRSLKAYRLAEDPITRAAILGSTAAFVGTLLQYNFFSSLYIIHVWVLLGFMVAAQNVALLPEPEAQR